MNGVRANWIGPSVSVGGAALIAYSIRSFVLAASFPLPPPLIPTACLVVGVALLVFGIQKYRKTQIELLQQSQRKVVKQISSAVNNTTAADSPPSLPALNPNLFTPETRRTHQKVTDQMEKLQKFRSFKQALEEAETKGKEIIASELGDDEDWEAVLPRGCQSEVDQLKQRLTYLNGLIVEGERCIHNATKAFEALPNLKGEGLQQAIDTLCRNVSSLHTLGGGEGYVQKRFNDAIQQLSRDKDAVVHIQETIKQGIKNTEQQIENALQCSDEQIPAMIAELERMIREYEDKQSEEGGPGFALANWFYAVREERITVLSRIVKTLKEYQKVSMQVALQLHAVDSKTFDKPRSRNEQTANEAFVKDIVAKCNLLVISFSAPYSNATVLINRLEHSLNEFEATQKAKLQAGERRLQSIEKECARQEKEMDKILCGGFSDKVLKLCYDMADLHIRVVSIDRYLKEEDADPKVSRRLELIRRFKTDGVAKLELNASDRSNIALLTKKGSLSSGIFSLLSSASDPNVENLLAKQMVLTIIRPTNEGISQLLRIFKTIQEENQSQWRVIEGNDWLRNLLLMFYNTAIVNDPRNEAWTKSLEAQSFEGAKKYVSELYSVFSKDAVNDWLINEFNVLIKSFDYSASRASQKKSVKLVLLFARLTTHFKIQTDLSKSRVLLETVATNRKDLFEPISAEGMPQMTPNALLEAGKALTELQTTEAEAIKRWKYFTHMASGLAARSAPVMDALRELPGMDASNVPVFERNVAQLKSIVDTVGTIVTKAEGAYRSYEQRLKKKADQSFLTTLQDLFSSDPLMDYAAALARESAVFTKHMEFLRAIGIDDFLKKAFNDDIFTDFPEHERGNVFTVNDLLGNLVQRLPRWHLIIDTFLKSLSTPAEVNRKVLACVDYGAELSDLYAQIEQTHGSN